MRRGPLSAALTAAVFLSPRPLWAGELTHRPGPTETLETIAKNYYGKSWKAVYILTRNGLTPTEPLTEKRLVIPASWLYTVGRGESLALIAKRKLRDPDRHHAIMHFNNIRSPSDLAVGQQLLMPFHLFYSVQSGDTLSRISQRFYRTTRRAKILGEYNHVDVLQARQTLVVPIFDSATVDVSNRRYSARQPSTPAPVQNSAPTRTPPPTKSSNAQLSLDQAQKMLRTSISRYGSGLFDEACTDLETLLEENVLRAKSQVALIKYLGFCAIAFGDQTAARDYFHKWIELDKTARLDPVTTSPKILAVFHEVTGSLRSQRNPDSHGAEVTP